jgi:hypothetical protein
VFRAIQLFLRFFRVLNQTATFETANCFSAAVDVLLRRSLSCARRDAFQDLARYLLQLPEPRQVVLELAVQIERSCRVEFRP